MPQFSVVEATIAEMQTAMQQRRTTSRAILQQYLDRIARYEDRLNAIISLNPRVLEEADARDRERTQGNVRGPLHGIPIALKDGIHTTDMPTTGGALAFKGFVPPYEATLVKHLRDAGAIIIAKTNMTELGNWVASGMPGNYNALVGYGFNPYDPRPDPRSGSNDGRPALTPGGSSSGAGTAANFWAANVGAETSGSILSPASRNMLVGIKPTVGRISGYGVIPITADQDTPGPMARTVADAAVLLGVLQGTAPDRRDPSTRNCARIRGGYSRFLKTGGLKGARIGIPRAAFYETLNADMARVMTDAIGVLRAEGATVIDPVALRNDLPPACAGPFGSKRSEGNCSVVMKYGMKRDFNKWLASLGPSSPVKTLSELRAWNTAHRSSGAIKFGQMQLDNSDEMDVESDRARYISDRENDLRLSRTDGIDAVMKRDKLDALLVPPQSYDMAARAGYPSVVVPFGFVPNVLMPPFPAGFDPKPSPIGVSFTAMACSEPRLIEIAYAFEQATKRRVPPAGFP
jgi:amidase